MYSRILVAYDGSACADLALREAARLALEGGRVVVLAVAETPSLPRRAAKGQDLDEGQAGFAATEKGRVILEQASRRLAAQDITPELMLVDLTEQRDGNIARTILEEAQGMSADLIVMGTHGRQGFKRFLLGSVAERVVRESNCPVLLLRGDGPSAFDCLNPAEIYGQWPEDERLKA